MRVVRVSSFGGPEVITCTTGPDPELGPGDVLVRVCAAALNRRDVWLREGLYPGGNLPLVPGSDAAGVIVAAGAEVDPSVLGWEVVINPGLGWGRHEAVQDAGFSILGSPHPGTFAELVAVPVSAIHTKPAGLSMQEAAALPLAAVTAFRALVTRGQVQVDERVLVTGAGGGVATYLIQMARYCGARVFVTTGSPDKLKKAEALGAEGGVCYTVPGWADQLREMMDGGADLVMDGAGGAVFGRLLEVARPGGRIVTYGSTLGPASEVALRQLFWKQLTVLGTTMGSDAEFVQMLRWADAGAFAPVVDSVWPLERVADAFERLEGAAAFGKVVVEVQPA
ncbi:MAG: zinc-binding dehydrogenase [Candidatus Sericytochromatia bacterium]|nr:zinc-binding dehydrogenase [Candidatus Sericytochromatia bacterium]